jgi:hypothetical protein
MLVVRAGLAVGLVSSLTLAVASVAAQEPVQHGPMPPIIRRISPAPPGAVPKREAPAPATNSTHGTSAVADSPPMSSPPIGSSPSPPVIASDAAARIYLAQALASLGRAEQLAQQASQYGDLGTFDVERFLGDLRTISGGLSRFLLPDAPEPGPQLPVEITGQYLYDGLSRGRQPRAHSPPPHTDKEPRP